MSERCPHCINGVVPARYSYAAHPCPDCQGTGEVSYCTECDEQIPGDEELCDECADAIFEAQD